MSPVQRNKFLLVSLLVLLPTTALLFYWRSAARGSDLDPSMFKIEEQINVNRVVLERSGEKIELNYNRITWQVNAQEADRQLVKVFFATLLQAEPKRKLTGAKGDSIRMKMTSSATRVLLWDDDVLVKEFFVLGNSKTSETYYQLQGDAGVYLVTIPGYRVYLASIFELSPNDWRERRLFNFNWQNFKRLSASFPSQPNENFSISFNNSDFGVENFSAADTAKVNTYLDAVSLIKADRILSDRESPAIDSATAPDMTLEVFDIANRSMKLSIYVHSQGIFGRWNDLEWVQISAEALRPVFYRRSHFGVEKGSK